MELWDGYFKSRSCGLRNHVVLWYYTSVSEINAVSIFFPFRPLHPGYADSTDRRNVGILPQHYTSSEPRRHRLETSPPWKPQNSKIMKCFIMYFSPFSYHFRPLESKFSLHFVLKHNLFLSSDVRGRNPFDQIGFRFETYHVWKFYRLTTLLKHKSR